MAVNLVFWQCGTNVLLKRKSFSENQEEGNVHKFSDSSPELYNIHRYSHRQSNTANGGTGFLQVSSANSNELRQTLKMRKFLDQQTHLSCHQPANTVPAKMLFLIIALLAIVVGNITLRKIENSF